MNITINHNHLTIICTTGYQNAIKSLHTKDSTQLITNNYDEALHHVIHNNNGENNKTIIFYSSTKKKLTALLQKHFTKIQAGGGVVANKNGEILLIYRRGKWDLPKGKLDDGETIAACAAREIMEETGVLNLQQQQHLTTTYHTYKEKEMWILKETTWYTFTTNQTDNLIPQLEEGIEEIKWVAVANLASYKAATYTNIIAVLDAYIENL